MSSSRLESCVAQARFEAMESRLLMSATSPALPTTVVTYEQESGGGSANNDIATAEMLTFSPVRTGRKVCGVAKPQQALMIGQADGMGGGYDVSQYLFAAIGYPQIYTMDLAGATAPGGNGTLTIKVKANLAGADQYLTVEAEGMSLGDLFVTGGSSTASVTTQLMLTQQQLATLSADGVISLTIRPSEAVTATGVGYVNLHLTYPGGAGTADYYRMDLLKGESVALAVQAMTAGQLDLQICDAAGSVLATGSGGYDSVATAIANFVAPQAGAYNIRVAGNGQYNLVVNRNAAMDLGPNNSLSQAQTVNLSPNSRSWVIGQLDAADTDFYSVTLAADSLLKVRVSAPDGQQLPVALRLYDSQGNLLVETTDVQMVYRVPKGGAGTYYVQVESINGSSGDYLLSFKDRLLHSKSKPRHELFGADVLSELKNGFPCRR